MGGSKYVREITPQWIKERVSNCTGQVFHGYRQVIQFGKYRGERIGELFTRIEEADTQNAYFGREEKDYLVWAVNHRVIAFASKKLWERYYLVVSKQFLVEGAGTYSDDPMEEYLGFGYFC